MELIMQKCSVDQLALLLGLGQTYVISMEFLPRIAEVYLRVSHVVAVANERRLYSQARA